MGYPQKTIYQNKTTTTEAHNKPSTNPLIITHRVGKTTIVTKEPTNQPFFDAHLEYSPPDDLNEKPQGVEALALRQAVKLNPHSPLDEYALRVIKLRSFVQHDLQEVFDLILQRPHLLERLDNNAQGIPAHEVYKRLYDVLLPNSFQHHSSLPAASLLKTPEYFLTHGPLMQQLLEKFAAEGTYESYCFVLYLCDTVHQHAQYLLNDSKIEEKEKTELKKVINIWPCLSTLFPKDEKTAYSGISYLEAGLKMLKSAPSFMARIDMETFLLNMVAKGLEQNLSLETLRNDWPQLLLMASHLKMASEATTMPGIALQAALKVEEHLIPQMLTSSDKPQINNLFNNWLTAAGKAPPSEGLWEPAANKPGIWECGKSRIDLVSLQILSDNNGASVDSFKSRLPKEVVKHPIYKMVFGIENLKEEVLVHLGNGPGELVYLFSDEKNVKYELTHKAGVNEIVLRRQIPEKNSWAELYFPEIDKEIELTGPEKNLRKKGIWIDPKDPLKGQALFGSPSLTSRPEETFQVILSPSGKIQKLAAYNRLLSKPANQALNCESLL